ncbi:histidinol-phosphate transaminase [Chloroflexota bacterium]
MTNTIDFIRQHIQDLPPYEPILPLDVVSEELGIPVEKLVKMDANENPYGPLPEVQDALAVLDSIHIYPDPESRRIRKLLAQHHQISEQSIVIGAGADELIDLIMRIVINPGDSVLNCPPTFGMYAFDSVLNQSKLISVPRLSDFSIDIPNILQAIKKYSPKILFIANPNNPDGGIISESDFKQLVNLPLLLVMDEAYFQFVNQGKSNISEVCNFRNLIVLRTFSKWAGLAGLRIGYGVFPKSFVPMLMKAKQPYNVSAAAEQAAVVTMQNIGKVEKNIANIVKQRSSLCNSLKEITWLKPYPSQANFLLCKVDDMSALEVKQQLRKKGILIRYFDKPGLSDHIRISIGTQEQNEIIISALKGIK